MITHSAADHLTYIFSSSVRRSQGVLLEAPSDARETPSSLKDSGKRGNNFFVVAFLVSKIAPFPRQAEAADTKQRVSVSTWC